MSDKLKSYIEHNREELEVYEFDLDQGWSELSNRLEPDVSVKKLKLWKSIAAAASILLVASLSFIIIQNGSGDKLPIELVETQNYYQQQIDQKVALVRSISGSEELVADLERMDAVFEELKGDLQDDVHNEAVVTAMIDNYRLKLRILEEILEELEEQNDEGINNI
jgi:ribosomal protein S25